MIFPLWDLRCVNCQRTGFYKWKIKGILQLYAFNYHSLLTRNQNLI
jgi:hypothetical protein